MFGRRGLLVTFVLLLIAAAIALSVATRTSYVRDRAVTALNQRFASVVELESLQVSVFPRPEVSGGGLRLRHNGRTDVPPLIAVGAYSASAGLFGLFRTPMRLRTIEMDRLDITIPPGGLGQDGGSPKGAAGGDDPERAGDRPASGRTLLAIDRIISREARLEIVPRDPGKLPRVFEIHDLVMNGFGDVGGVTFQAVLTNPTPRGSITTRGRFGPWRADTPSTTPLHGDYAFENADLNTIKGIAGTLSSTGTYSGVLERIDVKGETVTADFAVDHAGQPVPLKTRFHAVVDGTNGNTRLEQVEARVLETVIVARGAVVRAQDVKGRRVTLDVAIENGRIEDVLKLGVKSKQPLMTGAMQLETKFLLPAGDRDVIDKLELESTFRLEQARFTNVNVQQRIDTLSRRGQGELEAGPSVVSDLAGRFVLRNGTLTFSELTFAVPGAVVELAGHLNLRSETLDFKGHLLLDAKLSQTTSGIKAAVAAIAQPLFRRKGGGSKLPIKVSGTMSKPSLGLDMKKALLPGR